MAHFIDNFAVQTLPSPEPTMSVYLPEYESNEYEESTVSPITVEPSTIQATSEIPVSEKSNVAMNTDSPQMSEAVEEKYLRETVNVLRESNSDSSHITHINCTGIDFEHHPCLQNVNVQDKSQNHIFDLSVPQINPLWLISLTFEEYVIFPGTTTTKNLGNAILISYSNLPY